MSSVHEPEVARTALAAISNVFASLGRYLLCLDENFRVVHSAPAIRDLMTGAAFGALEGRSVAEILGKDLFGAGAPLRDALEAGERREGWRALLHTAEGITPLSISAAPLLPDPTGVCDARVKYVVVVLPSHDEHFSLSAAPAVLAGLIARSPSMARIFHLVENLQASDAPVLLTGERGTGKELIARAIHEHSPRRRGPFISVNCGAVPAELLASELFGHVRGAFPGAVRDRVGRIELAAQGTLFLEETSELPLSVQARLLRVLHEQLCERVGDSQPRPAGARIIAATNVDLRECVSRGLFREDLYLSLKVVPIEIPPLAARREDIEPLARLLLRRIVERHGRHVRLSPEVIRAFLNYHWPGNVQELENTIEYAVAVSRGPVIEPDDLPAELAGGGPKPDPAPQAATTEAQRLRAALEEHRWRREETARALGISRATLWRRMREFNLL
jgi:DNA-binding NtrC family response regulator